MDKVRTVSDTKRAFYSHHNHPINSIYRRVVEELMVEMHLLSVNTEFNHNPIYALGVVTSFDRFMVGYQPEADRESIFNALCLAVEGDPAQHRQESEHMLSFAQRLPGSELVSWFSIPTPRDDVADIYASLQVDDGKPKYKYSRLFAIGLYTLLEQADPQSTKDEKRLNQSLEQIATAFNFSPEKIQKDLELYRGNLDKMEQARIAMEDALKAERKKRQQRALEKQKKQDQVGEVTDTNSTQDEASSST